MTSQLIAALAAMVESANNTVRQMLQDFMPYPDIDEDFYEGHPEDYAA